MDEVKMWTIEGSQVSPVQSIGEMDSERQLEDILVKNSDELLMPGLTLVGRQTQTEGGRLDLLGVDSDGKLVVFELKKGKVPEGAILQIIDYASYLEAMDLDALIKHISDQSGAHGIDDFKKWYTEKFRVEDLESLRPLRMFLVGLGADDTTERMVNFLAKHGVDISLLTFYGFTYEGKTLLARHVHREDIKPSSQEHRASLDSNVEKYGVSEQFSVAKKMFQENWRNPNERSNEYGLNFSLPNRSEKGRRTNIRSARLGLEGRRESRYWAARTRTSIRSARLGLEEHVLVVCFFSHALRLCMDDFKLPIQEIPFQTWPPDLEDNAREDLNTALKEYDNLEIQFLLDETEWETHKEKLDKLTHAVYDAQQRKLQGD